MESVTRFQRVIALMHDDVLLISSTTKPRIQNANVFPKVELKRIPRAIVYKGYCI